MTCYSSMMMSRLAVVSGALSLFLVVVTPRIAQTVSVGDLSIEWNAVDGCGSLEGVVKELTNILGESWQGKVSYRFSGRVLKQGDQWTATLVVSGEGEQFTRSISADSCETAVKVIALLIAVSLDPTLALSLENKIQPAEPHPITQSETSGSADQPTPAQSKSDRIEPDKPPEPKEIITPPKTTEKPQLDELNANAMQLALGAFFVTDIGIVPVVGFGFSLEASLIIREFCMNLSLEYLPPHGTDIANSDHGSITMQLLAPSLGAGYLFDFSSVQAGPLAGASFNAIWANSAEIERTSAGMAFWGSVWLSIAARWRIFEQLQVSIAPALRYSFSQPKFEIEGIGLVHQPAALTGLINIGFFFIFNHEKPDLRPSL